LCLSKYYRAAVVARLPSLKKFDGHTAVRLSLDGDDTTAGLDSKAPTRPGTAIDPELGGDVAQATTARRPGTMGTEIDTARSVRSTASTKSTAATAAPAASGGERKGSTDKPKGERAVAAKKMTKRDRERVEAEEAEKAAAAEKQRLEAERIKRERKETAELVATSDEILVQGKIFLLTLLILTT
jgi:hypothetical protein